MANQKEQTKRKGKNKKHKTTF